jgi:hypothetical protein
MEILEQEGKEYQIDDDQGAGYFCLPEADPVDLVKLVFYALDAVDE